MATKLLLLEDVQDLGRSGDIVKVRPGFARNYLFPNKLGVIADRAAINKQAALQEKRRQKAAEDRTESQRLAALIEKVTLTTKVKVDHEGHLYGSVSAVDIANLLQAELKEGIDKHWVLLKHPIKTLGTMTISMRLKEEVTSSFTLIVEADTE